MSQQRLVLDGLWRCLCPSFTLKTLKRHSVVRPAKPGSRPLSSTLLPPPLSACHQRYYSTNSSGDVDRHEAPGDRSYAIDIHTDTLPDQEFSHIKGADNKIEQLLGYRKSWQTHGVPEQLQHWSTAKLEAKLRNIADRRPNVHSATQILRLLIRDRCIRPEGRHYKWLIQCNADPDRGTPILVRRLLAEMDENGIPADSGTLHAALQAIAVHPDSLLRQDILRALRDRWLPLSPDGWHYVVAGLIREHQFELALDHIANMERKDIPVQDWLHSLLIYYLCEFNEFDQIEQLMRSRLSQGHEMTPELWTHVLDRATTSLHYGATCFIWGRKVELGYLHPEHWLCSKVLEVAASEGDTKLAASVVNFLTHNSLPLEPQDYENLSDAHLVSGNLYAAFEVLCKMHQDGLALRSSSTQAIIAHSLREHTHVRDVWAVLKELKAAGHEIPLACAGVVIEMCEHNAKDDPFEVDDGIAFYKELYTLCNEQPDTATFTSLISMCHRAKNTEAAMFIVKEMAAFNVLPDARTFERLVIMCLQSGNFESAYMYFHDLQERGFHPSPEARTEIRELCAESNDDFAIELKYHPDIHDGLVRSPADEIKAAEGMALFQKVRSESTGAFADLPQQVKARDSQREENRQMYLKMSKDERRQYNKERRKRKRRRLAIARAQQEDDWMDYEPGGLIPEDQLNSKKPASE
ncbi:hypothetical protein AOCH_003463 [Aspergillus ochraceoroseus]|nr:hypothetical protein AOCH_003463 [Aspergillus ochraceoroseus]